MKFDDAFDVLGADIVVPTGPLAPAKALYGPGLGARMSRGLRRAVDIMIVIVALPSILVIAALLLVLNPFLNPGPLFFRQKRMGKNCRAFMIWKFRTMRPSEVAARHVDAPLERDRVTPLGRLLRRSRLDELPNLFNVLRGDMSIIGPRPDAWDHAVVHIRTIPYYHQRFAVRPGITGLAQVRAGYAEDLPSVCRKARLDAIYVRNRSALMDLRILASTAIVMATGFGGR